MIQIHPKTVVSVWAGFGGAITEATAYNYSLLPDGRKKAFLQAYYADAGYAWGRLSIASNDFCLAPFEYTADAKLEDFSIEHDRQYVLAILKDVFCHGKINLVAAPWSPPSFMKSNHALTGGGRLRKKYYATYARYLRLFCEAYAALGYEIDFLSMQNEPEAAQRWESCRWSLAEQRKFINDYLLPELADLDTQVIVWDHNREKLCKVAEELVTDAVAGIGFHIYGGTQAEQLRLVRQRHPKALMINTESCAAFDGSWQGAAEYYLQDVMTCMNCGVNAYLDWNMLLDQSGGPTWADNPVKAPIMLNHERNDFVRTPIFGYLRVISTAFPPGTRIVHSDSPDAELMVVAGVYRGNLRIVLMNIADSAKKFEIDISGFKITGVMPPHTIIQR